MSSRLAGKTSPCLLPHTELKAEEIIGEFTAFPDKISSRASAKLEIAA